MAEGIPESKSDWSGSWALPINQMSGRVPAVGSGRGLQHVREHELWGSSGERCTRVLLLCKEQGIRRGSGQRPRAAA